MTLCQGLLLFYWRKWIGRARELQSDVRVGGMLIPKCYGAELTRTFQSVLGDE
jgi:hypothetical protein